MEGLNRPELAENRTAALFRFETNETPEALPGLSRALDDLLPVENSDLRRTINAWMTSVVRRTFPGHIIPEGMNLEEAMLEETLIKWRDQIAQEASQATRRKVLLKQMTQRFGRLPEKIRQEVEQITSDKRLERLERKILSAKSLQEMGLG